MTIHPFHPWLSEQPLEDQTKLHELFDWIETSWPQLKPAYKWHQPMYTDHGTFIIGFSSARNHISVAVEKKTLDHFTPEIEQAGLSYGKMLFRMAKNKPFPKDLLRAMIDYNIDDKKNVKTFWRHE